MKKIKGQINEKVSDKQFSMKCKELQKQYVGTFDFIFCKKRNGEGIINKNGKEYLVKYDFDGKKSSRKRTFEGIRLMIIGNRYLYNFVLKNLII